MVLVRVPRITVPVVKKEIKKKPILKKKFVIKKKKFVVKKKKRI